MSKQPELGYFGSPYSAADNLKTPGEIGVNVGDSMEDVIRGVKGVGYYADQIGFGQSSNSITGGMDLKPLGVNYFIKTGAQCSNGADMWYYMEGIPTGNALGTKVANAMKNMGLPPLKGLAPGMIEDAKNALNPMPLVSALSGGGYPECTRVTKPVGDSSGKIKDDDGTPWIEGKANCSKGVCTQTKWIQAVTKSGPVSITKEQFDSKPKIYNRDGTPIRGHGFTDYVTHPSSIIVIGVLCLFALGIKK